MSDVAAHLAALAADSSEENTAKYVRLLEDGLPGSDEELQACIAVFQNARKPASCQVVYERFIRNNPASWDVKLAYAELKVGLGSSVLEEIELAEKHLADFTFDQVIRLAELTKQIGSYQRAIQIVASLAKSHSDSLPVLKVLIPCYTGLGQLSKAKTQLQKFKSLMPGTVVEWAYVVDEVSKLGLESLFLDWAKGFEAAIPPRDDWSRFLLIRSYSRFIPIDRLWPTIVTKVSKLLGEIDIPKVESEWVLSVLFDVTETLGQKAHMLQVAHRLLEINRSSFDLAKRVRTMVDQHAKNTVAPFPFV